MSFKSDATRKPMILVADDQRMTRHMIRRILEHDEMIIQEAQEGSEALRMFKEFSPDMVLMDIVMPVMDGLEACARIKGVPEGRYVPVLMFTAPESGKEIDLAFRAGAADFISKPLNPEELRHRVKRLLYLRELEIEREKNEKDLKESFLRIQTLSRKVLQAYEEERIRLARELHDELGMTLTTLKLNLQILNSEMILPREMKRKENLIDILQLVEDALAAIRAKSMAMRPPPLADLGLLAVLENMLQHVEMSTHMKVQFHVEGSPDNLPLELETTIYRCVQEAITNAVRHSSAKAITVKLKFSDEEVFVSVDDNGIGFNVAEKRQKGDHVGLKGMEERVNLLNGKILIKSHKGRGTHIQIIIPVINS
jgi:signal transduction histidine kinase